MMDNRTVYLLFGLAASAIVAGTVLAASLDSLHSPFHGWTGTSSCRIEVSGVSDAAPRSDTTEVTSQRGKFQAVRSLTYPLAAAQALDLYSCVDTGSIEVVGGSGEGVLLTAKVHASHATEQGARDHARELTPVVRAGSGSIVAFEPSGRWQAGVTFRFEVPLASDIDAELHTDTGAVRVDGARLVELVASTDTGGIELRPSWAQGRLEARTDTGGVEAVLAQLGAARIVASTDTGGVRVLVPADARHGYDVTARVDTGGIDLDLPDLQDQGAASSRQRHARTAGYDAREVQVSIEASTDTGGVSVAAV